MKRTITGALIFTSAIFVGIQLAAFFAYAAPLYALPADLPEPGSEVNPDQLAAAPTGIRVSYIGGSETEQRFLIYNGSTRTITCQGYAGICATPQIRINAADATAWVCMNGSSHYQILPGATAEMVVNPYDFDRLPAKNQPVTIGYRSNHDGIEIDHYAEPLPLPYMFRNEIRKSLSQLQQ